MDPHFRELARFLADREIEAPEAVALLTRMSGEILRVAVSEGHTSEEEVETTIQRAAGNMRRRAGITAGSEAH